MRHQWNTHDATQNEKILKVQQFTHWSNSENICLQTCTYVTNQTKPFKISLLTCTQNSRISHHLPCIINKKLFGGGLEKEGNWKFMSNRCYSTYCTSWNTFFAPSNILISFYCFLFLFFDLDIFFNLALKDTIIIVNLRPTWQNLVKIKEMSLVTWRNKPLSKKLKEL